MKLCYCDETGTGEEPYAVLLAVVVDASRMHVTKSEWAAFLAQLSKMVGQPLQELHTRNFYSGSGIWKSLDGEKRSSVINLFINWFAERKHHVAFSVVDKAVYSTRKAGGKVFPEVDTVWKTMAFHVALGIQKAFQKEEKNKGNTIFVFDEEVHEMTKFQEIILQPPAWSDSYYAKAKKQERLDQIVDAPYFADSKNVHLLQVADFLSYFVRRHVEIQTGAVPEKYSKEGEKIAGWYEIIKGRSIGSNYLYPKKSRCSTADFFWDLSPDCIRK